jgi:hypothetical protein
LSAASEFIELLEAYDALRSPRWGSLGVLMNVDILLKRFKFPVVVSIQLPSGAM